MRDSHRVGTRINVMTIPLIRRLNCPVVALKKMDTIVEQKAPSMNLKNVESSLSVSTRGQYSCTVSLHV